MIRLVLLCPILLAAMAIPTDAHKLKVFATVDGDAVAGYAFFIGGGRAKGTTWIARNAAGTEIARGETDGEGNFRIAPPGPVTSDIVVTVDTREGHIASTVIAAVRLGAVGEPDPPSNDPDAIAVAAPADDTVAAGGTSAATVEAAVQRQIEPLLERIEEMDSRLRFTDAISGIFLIVGAAGILLWARRRA